MLQRFSIWIDKKTLASLKTIGKQKERPVGWIMRKAIEEFVENAKKKGQ
jgi:predicted transcriptional regulator